MSGASSRPQLRALARACGIADGYQGSDGSRRVVGDATREALVGAMGIEASTEAAAAAALRQREESAQARCLDPVAVVAVARPWRLRGRTPPGWRGRVRWSLSLEAEDGGSERLEGERRIAGARGLSIPCPPLALGIHCARIVFECEGKEAQEATQWVFAAPEACVAVDRRLGQARAFGLWAHLYSLARPRDLGIGDLGHLARLVDVAGEAGAAFVATQPFHAQANTWDGASPYSPTSRLFHNPIYLDLESVPELRESAAAREALRGFEALGPLLGLRTASHVDYEAVMHVKRSVLERLFRHFQSRSRSLHAAHGAGGMDTERGRAYRAWVEREGRPLQVYAAYCALAEHFGGAYSPRVGWPQWPARFHDADGEAVRAFARAHPDRIEFHCWLQFETSRQLQRVGEHAKQRLGLGLLGDLALGSGRGGADTWMHPGLFVEDANLGAPPDEFAEGQDWGLPPLHPARSRQDGHRYWRRVVRAAFEGMGALRVDHVMGLFRQFWVPAGRPPAEGAYVEAPSRELLALLAIESHRARAVVVGEDLGTRPPALSPRLARAGILSTRVLPFERTRSGFRAARRYGGRAFVTAHTHDLPPLRGWRAGRDLVLRHAAGELAEPGALEAALEERREELALLRRRLVRDGLLPADTGGSAGAAAPGDARAGTGAGSGSGDGGRLAGEPDDVALARAVTAFLGSTPAPLLALSVSDLAGERDPLNLPGVDARRYPSWTHRMELAVDDLARDGTARAILAAVAPDRRRRGAGQAADSTD